MNLVLYQAEWDTASARVRRRLDALLLSFYCVNVDPDRAQRDALQHLSGQREIPVLLDDGAVFVGEGEILMHLQNFGTNR